MIRAGDGNDRIEIGPTTASAPWVAARNVGGFGGLGTGVILPLVGMKVNTAVLNGGRGEDSVLFGDEADALFLHDEFAGAHPTLAVARVARVASIERIATGGGNDIVDLTSQIFSLAGARVEIDAGSGDDIVWGSDADELIRGGSGSDTLFGGTGLDTLEGGGGADVFEFTATSSDCAILDFLPEEGDVLRFYDQGGCTLSRRP